MGEPIIGDDRRLLAIGELEQIDQFPWHIVFETPEKINPHVVTGMKIALPNPRVMVELPHGSRENGLAKKRPDKTPKI